MGKENFMERALKDVTLKELTRQSRHVNYG
jgi:hypothetical protein